MSTNAVVLASAAGTGFFRNRIINGDMKIDQRNNGGAVTVSTDPVYVLDRWRNSANGGGAFSVQRVSDAPPGFYYSQKGTVTTADSSIASNDYYSMNQPIEGFNVFDLGWGTGNAQPITASFWVKSSIAGTYFFTVFNGGSFDRAYCAPYTISATNTWEKKTITIPGPTSGTFGVSNDVGFYIAFILGSGSGRQTSSPNTWLTSFAESTTAQTQWIATLSATFQITGVQVEAGTAASPFERRSYSHEFILCQRYYETSDGDIYPGFTGSAVGSGNWAIRQFIPFNTHKRAAPTMAFSGVTSNWSASSLASTRTGYSIEMGTGTSTNDPRPKCAWTASIEL